MPYFDPLLIALGFLVGVLIGLTGVGGGAVLTPLLILVAGVRPVVAVGTDLAFAAVTKAVGGWQHARWGSADRRLALQLACGSVPGALLGAHLVGVVEAADAAGADALVARCLGIMLLVAAGANLLRAAGFSWTLGAAIHPGPVAAAALGLGIGVMVGLTSVGAGSLLMAVLALFYALPAARAVGTDVVHGAVLAAVAAVAHGAAGRVELSILTNLLAGSLPGVLIGGFLCAWLPSRPLRMTISIMLAAAGMRLI
jgi:uncharacterized protein